MFRAFGLEAFIVTALAAVLIMFVRARHHASSPATSRATLVTQLAEAHRLIEAVAAGCFVPAPSLEGALRERKRRIEKVRGHYDRQSRGELEQELDRSNRLLSELLGAHATMPFLEAPDNPGLEQAIRTHLSRGLPHS